MWTGVPATSLDRHDVVRRVRKGDARRERVEIDHELTLERRVVVGATRRVACTIVRPARYASRRVVGRKDRGLGAHLDGEIATARADPRASNARDAGAVKLERSGSSRPRAELGDERERDVLRARRRGRRCAVERHLDRLRHAKPDLPGDHRRREIGRADAGRKQIQRAAGHRVAVGADHELPGSTRPRSDSELMADALADLETARAPYRAANARTRSWNAAVCRRRRRRVVIEREHDARGIEDARRRPSARSSRSPSAPTRRCRSRDRRRRRRCRRRARRARTSPRGSSR